MYSAETVAKYVINWYHRNGIHGGYWYGNRKIGYFSNDKPISKITNFRLNKLLYFLQGEYLEKTGERLIRDDFYAWEYGPVVPSVYYTYHIAGSLELLPQNIVDKLESLDERFVDKCLWKYLTMSTFGLVELSQSQDPWKYISEMFGKGTVIPFGCFENYFKTN